MTRIFYIILVIAIVHLTSCFENNSVDQNNISNQNHIEFPTLLDSFPNRNLKPIESNIPSYTDFMPLYFGKLKDTIFLEYGLYFKAFPIYFENKKPKKKSEYRKYYSERHIGKNLSDRETSIEILVDTSVHIGSFKWYDDKSIAMAFPVYIRNKGKYSTLIGRDNEIYLITEVKNEKGEWKCIDELMPLMCGTGVQSILLPPLEIAITSAPVFKGGFKTKMRLKMENFYSNEFPCTINKDQIIRENETRF